jgi:hypothetical protein
MATLFWIGLTIAEFSVVIGQRPFQQHAARHPCDISFLQFCA